MGGIINYYHGEAGRATGLAWVPDEQLTYRLALEGDPHRHSGFDYGTDIGVDPRIREGDDVLYLRLDGTCGIWVRATDAAGPALPLAVARVQRNRQWMSRYADAEMEHASVQRGWLDQLERETGVGCELAGTGGAPRLIDERPATEASLFVSYSSMNVLLARRIYADLRNDAKAEVWFDIAQAGESPRHDEQIAEWLRTAIYRSRGLVLLLTRAALKSSWVWRELEWSLEQTRRDPSFHLVVLKLADVAVPEQARQIGTVIDCRGLWRSNGINEELFAALFRREGRRGWLEWERLWPDAEAVPEEVFDYADFESDGGLAVDFRCGVRGETLDPKRTLSWRLTYESGGVTKCVGGEGEGEPVDLSIKPGDRVGSFVCRHRWGTSLSEGVPLWMRTDGLEITPDIVLDGYYERLGTERLAAEGIEMQLVVGGWDVYGRALSELWVRQRTTDRSPSRSSCGWPSPAEHLDLTLSKGLGVGVVDGRIRSIGSKPVTYGIDGQIRRIG
ncbi:MAG: toll/interleukin-1 receptor domain-containing protein [Actinomycetota bacterium]|nr:toll/interleukin-1 receptor domain-containing protein [Actinomycetota bacterium]